MPFSPQLTINAPQVTFDLRGYEQDLQENCQRLLRAMARAFLDETIKRIPVDTGMARGTMAPVSRVLGLAFQIAKGPNKPRQGKASQSNYNKSYEGGTSRARVTLSDGPIVYAMHWSANLFHLLVNDLYHLPGHFEHPTPWHAIASGVAAAEKFFIDNGSFYLPTAASYYAHTRRVTE